MAAGVLMPKAGISVESCIITQWLKQTGDTVKTGDILFSYETDKASFECESTADGTLLELFYDDGDEVPVLVNVCAVGNPGEDVSALRPAAEAAGAAPAAPAPDAALCAASAETAGVVSGSADGPSTIHYTADSDTKLAISPRAKHLAEDKGVDVRLVAPTGPYGRVIERDIRAAIENGLTATAAAFGTVGANAPAAFSGTGVGGRIGVNDLGSTNTSVFTLNKDGTATLQPEYHDVAFTGIRKAISRSMTQSLSTIPQLTHNFSFNASEMMRYRSQLKDKAESFGLPNITLNDMILYAVSRLLPKYPELNAHMLDGNTIRYFTNVNLGIAVDTERGLLVPVLKSANRKSLSRIAIEAKALAKAAQAGTLPVDDMQGGTFTISNLGSLGVESFTPVINPPQTGLLGVDNIIQRPYDANGEIKLYPAMGISLTYDHRAIDGAPASRFAKELCDNLSSFSLLLAL